MIVNVEFSPYEKSQWTAYGPRINNGKQYVSPTGTLWYLDRFINNVAQLWTVSAWGNVHRESVNVYEFKATWREYRL